MKKTLGAKNALYPLPTVLVGAMVHGKPNFITIAHVGVMDFGTISLSMNTIHHTNIGIREHGAFSVNIPSVSLVKETDYCGLESGKQTDKSQLFTVFYGTLPTAPMIQECRVNMECRVVQTIHFSRHEIFVGEIVETYCDEPCLTDGVVDLAKVQPILFSMLDVGYWSMGERFAQAWSIGKQLQRK